MPDLPAVLAPVPIQDRRPYRARMNGLLDLTGGANAILAIDMQRDYLDEAVGSNLLLKRDARRVMAQTTALVTLGRSLAIPVVHAYVCRRAIEIEYGLVGTPLSRIGREHNLSQNVRGQLRSGPDRLEGSQQAEIPSALLAPGDIHVVSKKTMDAFLETDLDFVLRRVLAVDTLIVAGINTDTCVYNTAFSAANRGYRTVVVCDCTASVRGGDHQWMALELMSRTFAWVLSLRELRAKLRTAPAVAPARHRAGDHPIPPDQPREGRDEPRGRHTVAG